MTPCATSAPLRPLAFLALALGLAGFDRATGAELPGSAATFQSSVKPLLEKYCYECHGNGRHKGDVTLDSDLSVAAIHVNAKKWETVMERVHSHEMPPEDADALPSNAEREVISGWIEQELFHVDPTNPDPGRVTIHRLNRTEYNNTIRDLVGVDFKPADDFPADNSGYGFDNISDVLSLSPVLLEKYLSAARRILDEALPTELPKTKTAHLRANLMLVGFNANFDSGDGWMPIGGLEEDAVSTITNFMPGDYIVRVLAYATPEGKHVSSEKPLSEVPIVLTCMLDDTVHGTWKVDVPKDQPRLYEMRIGLPAGRHRLGFANRHLRGGENELVLRNGRPGPTQGGTVYVKTVDIEGPLPTATRRVPASKLEATGSGVVVSGDQRILKHEGEVALTHHVPAEGEYIVRVQASAQQAGSEPVRMELRVDGKPVHTFDVLAPAKLEPPPGERIFSLVLLNAVPYVYEYRVKLPAGDHRLAAAFINDFADPENKNPNLRDRNLIIDYLEIASLADPAQLPPRAEPLQRLFTKAATPPAPSGLSGLFARLGGRKSSPPAPAEQARTILAEFTHRAWRRPVAPAEVDALMQLYTSAAAEGASFDASVKFALQAVLVSPYFLFRGEAPPAVIASNSR